MAKRIADLTAADFPEVDAGRFEEWKAMYATVATRTNYAMIAVVGAVVVYFLVGGVVGAAIFVVGFVGWLLVMWGHIRPLGLRAEAYGNEIGIDDAALLRVGIDRVKDRETRRRVVVAVVIVAGLAIAAVLAIAYLGSRLREFT